MTKEYIKITREPTEEDYFRSKIYGIPFLIYDIDDLIKFNIIDFERINDMEVFYDIAYEICIIENVKLKNDVVVHEALFDPDGEYSISIDNESIIRFSKKFLSNYPNVYDIIFDNSIPYDEYDI